MKSSREHELANRCQVLQCQNEELVDALESICTVFGKMKPMPGEPYGRGVAELLEARAVIARTKGAA